MVRVWSRVQALTVGTARRLRFLLRHIGRSSLAGVFASTISGGIAGAITDTDFTYSSAQTRYYSIHPMGLAPADLNAAANWYTVHEDTFLATNNLRGSCFQSELNLPDGSDFVSLALRYSSSVDYDPSVFVVRSTFTAPNAAYLVKNTLVEDTNQLKVVSFVIPRALGAVNNGLFLYAFKVCLGPGDRFYGARLKYTYTSAGE